MHICDDCKQITYNPVHYVMGKVRCNTCSEIFRATNWERKHIAECKRRELHQCDGSTGDVCEDCCEHEEHDHYICNECGAELDPGVDIDNAEYYFDTER